MTALFGGTGDSLTGADRVAISVALVSFVAGIVLLVAVPGYVAAIIGACLLGLAGIAAVALVFLLVGEGEDRDYERRPR